MATTKKNISGAILGLFLAAISACITVCLMPFLLEKFGVSIVLPEKVAALGEFAFAAYGFSSLLLPLIFFVAAVVMLAGAWKNSCTVNLCASCLPFFTFVIFERIYRQISAGGFEPVKLAAVFAMAAILSAIEMILAGIVCDVLKVDGEKAEKPAAPEKKAAPAPEEKGFDIDVPSLKPRLMTVEEEVADIQTEEKKLEETIFPTIPRLGLGAKFGKKSEEKTKTVTVEEDDTMDFLDSEAKAIEENPVEKDAFEERVVKAAPPVNKGERKEPPVSIEIPQTQEAVEEDFGDDVPQMSDDAFAFEPPKTENAPPSKLFFDFDSYREIANPNSKPLLDIKIVSDDEEFDEKEPTAQNADGGHDDFAPPCEKTEETETDEGDDEKCTEAAPCESATESADLQAEEEKSENPLSEEVLTENEKDEIDEIDGKDELGENPLPKEVFPKNDEQEAQQNDDQKAESQVAEGEKSESDEPLEVSVEYDEKSLVDKDESDFLENPLGDSDESAETIDFMTGFPEVESAREDVEELDYEMPAEPEVKNPYAEKDGEVLNSQAQTPLDSEKKKYDENIFERIAGVPHDERISALPAVAPTLTGDEILAKRPSAFASASYSVPTECLLEPFSDDAYWEIDEVTERKGELLTETLSEFRISAEITGIRKGPVVTMFEVLPAPGVKLSKIAGLADNIALRLASSSVRIVAPIPGKHAVGIEIPNEKRSVVSFRELIEKDSQDFKKMQIPVALGKDITGDTKMLDLATTPHLLIAGSTGAGKSVCVNTIILSILFKRSPRDVKMILIDPKIVELKLYNDIPHLLTPVITEPKRAYQALQYCICEMERRYSLLDGLGTRDIKTYNKRILERNVAAEKLPYIVVIIDEFADLMATTGKELEATVARLAAMSRAVGIHIVLATQRPSIDVITGLIKANIPSRIAFMVASKTDSRIIIDQVGAEKLLGKGDMLYSSAVEPFPARVQGAFVSEDEVERVVEYVKTLGEPDYIDEEIFVDDEDDEIDETVCEDGNDPLYGQALQIVLQSGKASTSYIQRKLKIGFNRAARLIDEMELRGIVGPANGSKPREVIHVPS